MIAKVHLKCRSHRPLPLNPKSTLRVSQKAPNISDAIAFYESEPQRAKTLSPEQVQRFNRQGFVRPLDALSDEEIGRARTYFESLLDRMQAMRDGRNSYALDGYHLRCRGIWEMARHPRILDYVEDLLGPDFVCWSTHYFCKLGRDPKRVPWHQDATYWPVRPTMTVTAWLAIDDVDETNSPLQFMPGSHLRGAIEYIRAEGPTVLFQEVEDVERFGEPVKNVLKAGQISIHTSTLLHGSEPNVSDRRRCGLALRYIPSSCGSVAGAERVLNIGIPCRGELGRWRHNEPPIGDNLTPLHRHYRD